MGCYCTIIPRTIISYRHLYLHCCLGVCVHTYIHTRVYIPVLVYPLSLSASIGFRIPTGSRSGADGSKRSRKSDKTSNRNHPAAAPTANIYTGSGSYLPVTSTPQHICSAQVDSSQGHNHHHIPQGLLAYTARGSGAIYTTTLSKTRLGRTITRHTAKHARVCTGTRDKSSRGTLPLLQS